MHQPRRHGADDVAFSAYSADSEDYYAFLPSDESMSDVEEAPVSPKRDSNCDPVDELASVFASSSSIGSSSKVLTPIGSLGGGGSTHKEAKANRKQTKDPAPGFSTSEAARSSGSHLELWSSTTRAERSCRRRWTLLRAVG